MKVFLPCRRGSQRIPQKNIKKFGSYEGGLVELKLLQLLSVPEVDEILLSTNDEEVICIAEKFENKKIRIDMRPEALCTSQTTTDELILYFSNLWRDEHIMWTHVTAPFFTAKDYSSAINTYVEKVVLGDYDSLFSVLKVQSFLWDQHGPMFDREKVKWPFTQSIDPIFEADSAVFMIHSELAKRYSDRIGLEPFKYMNNKLNSIDIDYPEDFEFAERIWIALNSQ